MKSEHDSLVAIAEELCARVDTMVADQAAVVEIDPSVVDELVTHVTRFFFARSEAGAVDQLNAANLSATEALTLVGALLTSQNINAFDLSLWLSHLGAMPSSEQ
ncbi:hypothetical protein JL108_09005 [Aeromicrobium sp. YIM 150415]|uniref:hypothetical protein n=1 Tax=Aeromicrobium sp. YIM 150415 TaxID=2803912 RepID=UPI00196317BE|nr:hypothetical protein [Aeromicrobium sp. YIM 150415]MBM9463589.1 hypothetical protein [Aeromicrobium sp. YIM 150415]